MPVIFVKGYCLSNKVNTIKKNTMKDQDINKDHLHHVHMMSAYHYILRSPCKIYHKKGQSDLSQMFSGGCVFIDHVSGYVIINHQVDINYTETAKGKTTLEREAQSQVVVIKGYHTSNGILNA